MNRDYLVIVPTYNEITSIGVLLPQLLELNLDILIVDDGSPDGTADACRALGLESGRIVVVERKKKLGWAVRIKLVSNTAKIVDISF